MNIHLSYQSQWLLNLCQSWAVALFPTIYNTSSFGYFITILKFNIWKWSHLFYLLSSYCHLFYLCHILSDNVTSLIKNLMSSHLTQRKNRSPYNKWPILTTWSGPWLLFWSHLLRFSPLHSAPATLPFLLLGEQTKNLPASKHMNWQFPVPEML